MYEAVSPITIVKQVGRDYNRSCVIAVTCFIVTEMTKVACDVWEVGVAVVPVQLFVSQLFV